MFSYFLVKNEFLNVLIIGVSVFASIVVDALVPQSPLLLVYAHLETFLGMVGRECS